MDYLLSHLSYLHFFPWRYDVDWCENDNLKTKHKKATETAKSMFSMLKLRLFYIDHLDFILIILSLIWVSM